MTLIEFLTNLFSDPEARAEFNEDPQGALQDAGFSDVSAADLKDAIDLVNDGRDTQIQAPEVSNEDVSAHEYIQNVVNNIDNSVTYDNSINIDSDGGDVDFNQDNSVSYDSHDITADHGSTVITGDADGANIASGDHAVAGDGNTAVDGDGNTVGDGNTTINGDGDNTVVGDNSNYVGDHATASFGSGDANSTNIHGDVNASHGGSFAAGGSSSSVDNHSDDDYTDNSHHTDISDSGNTHTSYEDSFNSHHESSYSDDDSYSSSHDDHSTHHDSHDVAADHGSEALA
jgi:hypothetical protein